VEVEVLIGPGKNPHNYNPPASKYVWVEDAQLLLVISTQFESTVAEKVAQAYPSVRVVQTGQGVDLGQMPEPHSHEHAHGHGHGQESHEASDSGHDHGDHEDHHHDHGGSDPHIWLDPLLVRDHVAPKIAEALIAEAPEFEQALRENLDNLQESLTELHEELHEVLEPLEGKTFYVYHPALGHFARRYGMVQEAIELDGKSPSPRRIERLIDQARSEGVKVIFVQEQFPSQSAEVIAGQIDGAVVSFNPLGGDYLQMLRQLARTLREQLGQDAQ
jgi:zinc transport system substrate-binding protein